ncbi:MAG TPA: ATP-binding cassette domain-containing protein [Tepidisphaeraceae bacterium]|nr:ATP-binding cassette domain-containing protein [Tepidisphaeraceae bacterium]
MPDRQPPIAPPAIALSNVGLRRGQTWILRDVSWTVPAGACAAILGPNGSGKSTLTRILACHYWPTEGESSVLGAVFGDANLLELRKSIRLVQPAGPYDIDGELTARQAVLTGFFGTIGLYDPTDAAMDAEADRLLDQVGLTHVRDHTYGTLSNGEKVRTLIARALVREPRLLLLDEPTAGLDLLAREQVLATVQALFEPGASASRPTVMMITHHVEELPPATSHVLLLDEGRAAAQGSPAEVLTDAVLSRVYKCRVRVRVNEGRHYVEVHPTAWRELLNRK